MQQSCWRKAVSDLDGIQPRRITIWILPRRLLTMISLWTKFLCFAICSALVDIRRIPLIRISSASPWKGRAAATRPAWALFAWIVFAQNFPSQIPIYHFVEGVPHPAGRELESKHFFHSGKHRSMLFRSSTQEENSESVECLKKGFEFAKIFDKGLRRNVVKQIEFCAEARAVTCTGIFLRHNEYRFSTHKFKLQV